MNPEERRRQQAPYDSLVAAVATLFAFFAIILLVIAAELGALQ